MTNTKLYSYHTLSIIDVWDCRKWVRKNFDRYEGITSPLWNYAVQEEFIRLNAIIEERNYQWKRLWDGIGYDMLIRGIK